MFELSQGTCFSNLKFVSATMLEQSAFNPQNLSGHASLATPSFRKILKSHVRNIPGNMLVKFEVRNCK